MISFPNCKINLGLTILQKREDGFHDIETIFYPVSLYDIIEILPSENSTSPFHLTTSGLNIDTDELNNLCYRAYNLLLTDFPSIPSINMHLYKVIPPGAGLGGGSADGASTLKLLDKQFNLGLTHEQLKGYALLLGSDCPFFIMNKPCYARGRGELMEEVTLDLSVYNILLVNPGIHINTGDAFAAWGEKRRVDDKNTNQIPLKEIIKKPVSCWKEEMKNDFEEHAFGKYSVLKQIKNTLYEKGALYAGMSGSGSTLYGIFEKKCSLPLFEGQGYFLKTV